MSKVRSGGTGYTIVEVMLFLTVSGALFVSAMLLIGGQQQKTQFTTTVRDLDSKIQTVMGNVASGNYNRVNSNSCTAPSGTIGFGPGPVNQGQNSDCVFIGQVLIPQSSTSFDIYTAVGARLDGSGKEKTSLAGSKLFPTVVDNFTLPDGTTLGPLKYISSGVTTVTDSFGFITSFATYGSSLNSGSANTDIYAGFGSNAGQVDTKLAAGTFASKNPDGGVRICITDGKREGIIIVGGGTTKTTINEGATCA